ncbi:MAG: TldD/PmbA family protein, partial [Dehalococcoidales bacterium]
MGNILTRASQIAEEAEVYTATLDETPVQFESNRLRHIQSKQSNYTALRIIKEGKMGYAATTGVADTDYLVNTALETSQFGIKARFEFPSSPGRYPEIKVYDSDVESVPLDEMVKLGEKAINAIRDYNPDVVCQAEVNRGISSVHICNSRGGEISYRQSTFALGLEGQLTRDTDMLFVGENESSCHPINNVSGVTNTVLRQLELARKQARLSSKRMPVIFTPSGVASAILPPLMAAFNGKMIIEGASPLVDKTGQEIFDRKFFLSDDPTLDYRPESRPADDEGTPSRHTVLVEEGKVAGFIYDLQTAGLAGKKSTGNGSRNSAGILTPAPSSFMISPGKAGFQEMVEDIEEGLVIEYLMGAS